MSVQEIETAIDNLPEKDVYELADWLAEKRSQLWEKRLENDLDSGHFDNLIAELTEEYKQGLTKPL